MVTTLRKLRIVASSCVTRWCAIGDETGVLAGRRTEQCVTPRLPVVRRPVCVGWEGEGCCGTGSASGGDRLKMGEEGVAIGGPGEA